MVSARFWSNSLKELVRVKKRQIVRDGITLGIIIRRSVCVFVAPSILANLSILKFLAFEQTFKNSLTTLP